MMAKAVNSCERTGWRDLEDGAMENTSPAIRGGSPEVPICTRGVRFWGEEAAKVTNTDIRARQAVLNRLDPKGLSSFRPCAGTKLHILVICRSVMGNPPKCEICESRESEFDREDGGPR